MTAIIQQIVEEFIKREMEHGLEQGLSACLEASMKNFKDYLMAVLLARIQELDGMLAEKVSLRTGWQVVHKNVRRKLQTEYGLLRYERRYYRNEKKARYAYLVYVLMGVDSSSPMSGWKKGFAPSCADWRQSMPMRKAAPWPVRGRVTARR